MSVRHLLEIALRQNGFGVTLAASGTEAIALYEKDYGKIDAVLLDVRMPGLDGPTVLAALKRINPQVRCCFMSGHLGKYSEEELLGMSGTAVLRKPFVSMSHVAGVLRDMTS